MTADRRPLPLAEVHLFLEGVVHRPAASIARRVLRVERGRVDVEQVQARRRRGVVRVRVEGAVEKVSRVSVRPNWAFNAPSRNSALG